MSRRSGGGGGGILLPLLIVLLLFGELGGGGTAVDSEVNATAEVVNTETHEDSITAHINVTNTDAENGTVGLHVHYWSGECNKANGTLHHTHRPSTQVDVGETVTIRDTFKHDPSDIDCVSAHVHD